MYIITLTTNGRTSTTRTDDRDSAKRIVDKGANVAKRRGIKCTITALSLTPAHYSGILSIAKR